MIAHTPGIDAARDLPMVPHSPGPWSACHGGTCPCSLVWTAEHPVAEVTRGKWGDSYPAIRFIEGEGMSNTRVEAYLEMMDYGEISDAVAAANARLIAAAPELLHACQLALEVFDRTSVTDWEVLEKAIAKATGQ